MNCASAINPSSNQQLCFYQDSKGAWQTAQSINRIPSKFKDKARCIDKKSLDQNKNDNKLAAAKEIQLDGAVRKDQISSSIGQFNLRWPRKIESVFGRTPERALIEATNAVSKAIKQGAFPKEITQLRQNWNVVFLDENLPEKQIPKYLVSVCHPGWMSPPSDIYIVAQRIAGKCGNQEYDIGEVPDAALTKVLVHEIGHGLEYHIAPQMFANDSLRKEGFASWFEQYASDFSSVVERGSAKRTYMNLAKVAYIENPGQLNFSYSAFDYGRAAMYFNVVVEKRGIDGLMQVYQEMNNSKVSFFPSIEKKLGWNMQALENEVKKYLQSK